MLSAVRTECIALSDCDGVDVLVRSGIPVTDLFEYLETVTLLLECPTRAPRLRGATLVLVFIYSPKRFFLHL